MVYSDKLYSHYVELARIPCSAEEFAGCDMRFSTEYELLEFELGKAQSMHVSSSPDWQKVNEIAERMLRVHTKDLRVVVWLTWALYQRFSFPGLLAGLGLLLGLCEQHWAVAYPAKARTRCAALSWLVSRLDVLFSQHLLLSEQLPLFEALQDHIARLDELWGKRLGDDAPLLLPVRRQLSERLVAASQVAPEAVGVAGVMAQVKQVATQLLKPEQPVSNERDAQKLLRALQDQARPLCAWWMRQNVADPRAMRLSRTLTWLMLITYPDANSERVTALFAPAPDKIKRFESRFAQGQYGDLLLELEVSLTHSMFWFDGLRMAWECLEALQAGMAKVELEMSFALLLQRLPDLPEFKFADGTPFVDPATGNWIALHVAHHLQKGEVPNVVGDAAAQPWEVALQEQILNLRTNGLKPAVAELKRGLHAARSERARFHWRLALARLCMRAGKHDLSRIQLEQLDHELQQARLDRWEPELAFEVTRLLHRCYDLLPQDHAMRERSDMTHRRLCHFDLEAVLE
ncbi:type VI secretion system protein TssA [Pseudomonas tolaasii]|uniref:type VI secretion system protein TssA n=1 Tax=Pseudomonas tolaasii TaxID=29442 RepID=UPI002735DDE2|nr:type VI secretion system protein TssA [Pseudomonas tolaasii]WLH54410.1 type VI secretion system protein TssA [Pseudomonas tolaasii]